MPRRESARPRGVDGRAIAAAGALLATATGCAAAPGEAPVDLDASYRDGTYRAEGSYPSPAGEETIIVVLELADDTVTDVEIGLYPTSATSSTYQSAFALGISDVVVGVDIDALDVTMVAGSSLTSIGFRAAVEAIADDARAE